MVIAQSIPLETDEVNSMNSVEMEGGQYLAPKYILFLIDN